jgi:hypothetical protein
MVLIIYKGYSLLDSFMTNIGGIFTLGMAFFPAGSKYNMIRTYELFSPDSILVNLIHFAFTSMFFITMAYISIWIFTKSAVVATRAKRMRNRIYRICGYAIILSLILIILYNVLIREAFPSLEKLNVIFALQTIAFFAIGISWLTKGGVIIKDQNSE